MRMGAADALAVAEEAMTGAPAAVRRYALYGAWRTIRNDRFIPKPKKAAVFADLCASVHVEVVGG